MKLGAASEVSVYDRLVWPEGALESLLATGERRRAPGQQPAYSQPMVGSGRPSSTLVVDSSAR